MSLRALIVDDEPTARQRMRDLLVRGGDAEVVGEASSVPRALEMLREARPDVVFLDVEMPGADGFALLESLGDGERPSVVFVTAHEQYAARAFDVAALDYLLKPCGRDRLLQTLGRVRDDLEQRRGKALAASVESLLEDARRQRSRDDLIPIRREGRVVFLDPRDIDWIDAAHTAVRIQALGSSHVMREAMASLEQRLDPAVFLRVHRSTIVNVHRIQELLVNADGQYTLVLKTGQRLSVSRTYRDRVRERLRLKD